MIDRASCSVGCVPDAADPDAGLVALSPAGLDALSSAGLVALSSAGLVALSFAAPVVLAFPAAADVLLQLFHHFDVSTLAAVVLLLRGERDVLPFLFAPKE